MLNIILFGGPGSGKGTQSQKLIEEKSLEHISTGDIFRSHISRSTPLGKKVKAYMDEGNLVPDELVVELVGSRINEKLDSNGFIFDGFPRTVNQAKELDKFLLQYNLVIDVMISLEVSEKELKKRIKDRAKFSGRRDDQDESKIINRIKVYNNETKPVIAYYGSKNKHIAVKGVGDIDEIFREILNEIKNFY